MSKNNVEVVTTANRVQVFRKQVDGPWQPSIPERGTTHARGYDVRAFLPDGPITIHPLQTVVIPTGLFIALPQGAAMLVCSRSGLSAKGVIVTNSPGVIDSDYRGECNVILTYLVPPGQKRLGPTPDDGFTVTHGDRIAQWVYLPPVVTLYGPSDLGFAQLMDDAEFQEVQFQSMLPDPRSSRIGGFGSTGVQ